MNQKGLIVLNTASSYVRQAVRLGIGFALVPFVLSRVGDEQYGLYQTVLSLVGVLVIMDVGISEAVMRFVAREVARGALEEAREVWMSSLAAYMIPCTAILLLLPTLPWVAPVLLPGGTLEGTSVPLLGIGAVMLALTFPALAYRGVLLGLQRHATIAAIEIVGDLLRTALIVVALLRWSRSIVWVLAITAATTIATNLVLAAMVHRGLPWIRFGRGSVRWSRLRLILSFSLLSFVAQIGFVLNLHAHRLILSWTLGPAAVTAYFLACFARDLVEDLVLRFTSTLTPVVAKAQPTGDVEAVREILVRGTRYAVLMAALLAGPIAAFARPLLRAWLWRTPEYADLATLVACLLGLSVLELTRGAAPAVLVGLARMRVLAVVNLGTVLVDAALAAVLLTATSLGLYSLLVSTGIAVLARRGVVLWHVCDLVGVSRLHLLRRGILSPLLPGAVAYLTGAGLQRYLHPDGWLAVIGWGAVAGFVGLAVAATITLDASERGDLRASLRSLRGRPLPGRSRPAEGRGPD